MKPIASSKMQAAAIALQTLIACFPIIAGAQRVPGTIVERTLSDAADTGLYSG